MNGVEMVWLEISPVTGPTKSDLLHKSEDVDPRGLIHLPACSRGGLNRASDMQPNRRAACGIVFICILALWTDCVQGGSSFLSPSQKPQGKGDKKPPRLGRRFSEVTSDPFEKTAEDVKPVTFNAPFEIGITMTEEEFQEYGDVLQRIIEDLLTDPAPGKVDLAGEPRFSSSCGFSHVEASVTQLRSRRAIAVPHPPVTE
ncbi:ghrelin-like [Arapaima gigas]